MQGRCPLALATLAVALSPTAAPGQIRPERAAFTDASPDLRDQLRVDVFAYFRFVSRPWTARVCEVFADVVDPKEVTNLDGIGCLERPIGPPAVRVVDGTRQLGRLRHDVLAVGPTLLIPAAADRAEHWLDWWVSSWEPSYHEVHLRQLRSVSDLADIAFDSGFQLGAGKLASVRGEALTFNTRMESRLRKETAVLIEELLAGWRELGGR